MPGCSLLFEEAESHDGGEGAANYESAVLASAPTSYYQVDDSADEGPSGETQALDKMGRLNGVFSGELDYQIPGAIRGSKAVRIYDSDDSELALAPSVIDDQVSFSVELLFRHESYPQSQHGGIFIRESYENFGFRFGVWSQTKQGPLFLKLWCSESGCDDDGELIGTTEIHLEQWHHVALVYQTDGQYLLYLNGQLETEGLMYHLIGDPTEFSTGLGGISGKYHTASYDEIAFYDRALESE